MTVGNGGRACDDASREAAHGPGDAGRDGTRPRAKLLTRRSASAKRAGSSCTAPRTAGANGLGGRTAAMVTPVAMTTPPTVAIVRSKARRRLAAARRPSRRTFHGTGVRSRTRARGVVRGLPDSSSEQMAARADVASGAGDARSRGVIGRLGLGTPLHVTVRPPHALLPLRWSHAGGRGRSMRRRHRGYAGCHADAYRH